MVHPPSCPHVLFALITIVSADYGESHYIGPIKGAQPESHAWVDGFPHEPWLHLAGYYARAFKRGVYPAIETDTIYMWARPHLRGAVADDTLPRPQNWELVRNGDRVFEVCCVANVHRARRMIRSGLSSSLWRQRR